MPLYLRRIETVVSMQQLVEDAACRQVHVRQPPPYQGQPPSPGPVAQDLTQPISECLGMRLPRYSFSVKAQVAKVPRIGSVNSMDDAHCVPTLDDDCCLTSLGGGGSSAQMLTSDEDEQGSSNGSVLEPGAVPQKSLLDAMLLGLWEDCAEQGLFRYDVTACPTKVLPGIYGFVAQLNEGRATKKRPTEFRVDQVCQPFDPSKFNFIKAMLKEVLFTFEPCQSGSAHFEEAARCARSPNAVLINVSPIEYGHVLLVPRVLDCLPQLVDPGTVLLALRFAMEAANPYFRVGYNSLGAYATINHLHFQAYYLAAPLPCERAPTAPLRLKRKRSNVTISRTTDYPVTGFVLEVGDSLEEMAALVGQACMRMQEHNIPHNLLVSDSGTRVFIFPQCYAEKQAQGRVPQELLDTGVNPACWEIAGHMVMKRAEDYASFTQDLAWRLLAEVSLDDEAFGRVAELCFGAAKPGPAGDALALQLTVPLAEKVKASA